MADRIELLKEAERRGILPAPQAALLAEARSRGLVDAGEPEVAAQGQAARGPSAMKDWGSFARRSLPSAAGGASDYTPNPKYLPLVAGAAAGLAVPGAGWGALALQSLAAAGGGGVGELGRQWASDEPVDLMKAGKEGAAQGVGSLAGGGILKSLGKLASKIFVRPLSAEQTAAAEFAKEAGVPFKLSSAAPKTPAARLQTSAGLTISGQLKTHADEVKIGQFINRELSGIGAKGQVLDEAGANAQKVVADVFDQRAAITRAMDRFKQAAGVDSEIPIPRLKEALPKALIQLMRGGGRRSEAGRKIKDMISFHGGTDERAGYLLAQDLDDLLFTGPSKGGVRRIIQDAVIKDLDDYGKSIGISGFGDELRGAIKGARATLELGESVPGLAALAKSSTSDKTILWANQMMKNPQTREWLRESSPETFKDLADAWTANQFSRAAVPAHAAHGQVATGAQTRKWFVENRAMLTDVLGSKQAKAWDNLTLYMQYMDDAWRSGAKESKSIGTKALAYMGVGAGAQFGGLTPFAPGIIIAGEPAAFVLARGLNDPSSSLFRLFTEGVSPARRLFWLKASRIAGQQAGRESVKD